MDTTITISSKSVTNKSDFLHLTYNAGKNKDAIISVDSSNFGQSGSVCWDKKGTALSNIEKVTNWMKQSDKECVKSDFTELVKNNETESKSLILVRCDFNKSTNAQSYYQSPFNRSTSLINYFKDENCTLSNRPKLSLSPKMDGGMRTSDPKLSNFFHSNKDVPYSPTSKTESSSSTENKSENTDDVPLSSESRKKELCHYLQLMNPADKKEILIFQNRRSSRVKNLAEQKQFQEKLKVINNESDRENNVDAGEKSATLKSFKELNIQLSKSEKDESEKESHFLFPFPPHHLTTAIKDFDEIMSHLVPKLKKACREKNILHLTKIKPVDMTKSLIKSKQNKIEKIARKPRKGVKERIKSLRSNGSLKDVPLKKLIARNEKNKLRYSKEREHKHKIRTSKTPTSEKCRPNSPAKSVGSHCEIISVGHMQDEDIDIENFIDDMVDFDNLSEEHKKCLIESRILSTKNPHAMLNNENISCNNQISPLYGFSKADTLEVSKLCEKYRNSIEIDPQKDIPNTKDINDEKSNDTKEKEQDVQQIVGNTFLIVNIHTPDTSENLTDTSDPSEHSSASSLQEHDYAGTINKTNEKDNDNENGHIDIEDSPPEKVNPTSHLEVNTKGISNNTKYELLPYKTTGCMKSLHKSLQFSTKNKNSLAANSSLAQEWDIHNSPKQQLKKQSHFITIDSESGSVLKAFYVGYNLILCQEFLISFWMQTPLGNILGSQNMWIPRGQTQRIVLNNRCLQKDSTEKVICMDTSVVYIELWMKEHKSEMRQGPVADVFITLYYWKQRQNGLDKKVLQLENINGFADDVQYCVMKNFPKIIVSWHSTNEESIQSKKTFIHAYQLAADYQTVSNIYNMEPVDHYVSSLHNIEDYDDLIMGCGENKVTLWNVEFGHIIATVELNDIKTPLSTLWVKCDRGFLFALQQCVDRELRLIAINGINHSWKKLASYIPPEGFDRLKGVCIENGLLLSFYDQGILCWNAETGEPVEEINAENDVIPSGAYMILVDDNQIIVKHALTHLMSMSVDES